MSSRGEEEALTGPRSTVVEFHHPVEGASLWGWTTGDGPPVVLLHAGGERSRVWCPVASRVRHDVHVRCIAIDQRGHGRSPGRAERLQDHGDDVATVLRTLHEPALVVGASLGGMAAIDALRHEDVREAVAGLVLVDVVPAPDPNRVRLFLDRQGMLATHRLLIDDILVAGERLCRLLREAHLPTVLVRATRSAISDREVERLADLVSDLEVVQIDAGHLVARDAPTDLARTIARVADRRLVGSKPDDAGVRSPVCAQEPQPLAATATVVRSTNPKASTDAPS